MSTHSHGNSNIQSELLNGKKRCREEIPEPVASPEQEQRSKKKRRKKKKNKAKEEEQPNEHPQPQVCPKPLVATPIPMNLEPKINDEKGEKPNEAGAEHSVPDPTSPKDTPKKKKRVKKKKNIGAQPKEEPSNTEQPQPCSDLHHELNNKKEKGNEANAEYIQVCLKPPLDVTIQIDPGKKKGEGPNEATAEHPVPDPTPSNDTPKKKKRVKKKKNVLQPQGAQPKEPPSDAEHPQPQSCSEPGPGVPTIPIDKSKIKQRNRGGRKGMCSDEPVENPRNLSLMQRTLNLAQNKPDSPIPKPSSLIDQTILVDPAPSIYPEPVEPVGQTIPVDIAKLVHTEHERKKQDGKEGNIVLDGAGPNEHNMESSETLIQTSICHTAAPLVGPTVPVDPHPTIPTDRGILVVLEHKASKKKKRKRKSDVKSDGEKPNEGNMELIEAPADTSICHTAAPPVDPHPAIPTAGAILTDPEHKTSKKKGRKKKKKSDPKSEVEKPNEHNGKPPATPVQRSTYPKAAPSIEPATLKVAKQQMTKKKKKSALKIQGAKSDQDDTDLAAETQIQISRRVSVPKANHGSSMICQSCLQHGHKFERCPRLRCLSKDEEICFFCGEIGHSLGKCSVSKAGGGRFAKCLFCFETGHFTYDCQQKLQSI